MNGEYSDALVVFGITGDLAFKKILPALENLERRGRLPEIVIGVARGGLTRDALLARLRESLAQHDPDTDRDALQRLETRLKFIDGDYRDDSTFVGVARGTRWRPASLSLPRHSAEPVRCGRHEARQFGLRDERPGGGREAART